LKREIVPEFRSVFVRAPAKINLFLRILAKEDTGYHQIETLFAAVGLYDELHLHRTDGGVSVDVGGPAVGPEEENLAYRAARALLERVDSEAGVRIQLTKNIPVGAGLGGGSSDAGAMLRALNVLLGTPLSEAGLLELAGDLGSDVPFFALGAGAALAWGRGERLMPVPALEDAQILLALPGVSVSTALAYREFSATQPRRPAVLDVQEVGRHGWLAEYAVNDFESSIFGRHPELKEIRDAIAGEGAIVARLTGSGAALYGVFPTSGAAESARASLAVGREDVRFTVVAVLRSQPEPEPRT
jgi:4-diphosphocytidyl-2-C-methyl-D-erythritol kinase